jgi:sec-independent protein translocase protein TatC
MADDREEPAGEDEPPADGATSADDDEAGAGLPSTAEEAGGDTGSDATGGDEAPKTCAGTTQSGEPCGRQVSEENDFCYLHEDQAEATEPYEPTPVNAEEIVSKPADLGDASGRQGPAEDQEMPLAEHIEEMLKRLAIVIAVAGVVSLVTFPFADTLVNVLWNSVLPEGELTRPRLYGILELKLTELKVASLVGLIVALPVVVYQTYQFMKPGLYPHERRYYLAAVPTSLVLALVGVAFAYFIVLPAIFTYFLYYSQDVATIGFALGRTFDLILLLMGYLAVVFQIPLFIMLAMMMGLVTRRWLAQRRLLFWGAFLGISFIFSPDPTGMAPLIVALTMIVLFEGTLLLTKWTRRGRRAARSDQPAEQ